MLDLQAEKFNNRECIKNSEVMEAFRVSQDRVISMALIHEELYKRRETDTLDFSAYIENIEDLDSLGLQLVTSLVDQLDGKLELKRNSGTEFTIRFTVREK